MQHANHDWWARFAEKFEVRENGCWEWTAAKLRGGYGIFGGNNKTRTAHRLAYETLVGPVADGLHLDHLCRNRACVNPDHLEVVTPLENTRRGIYRYGEEACYRKFDDATVRRVRELRAEGQTYSEIAAATGVSRSQACNIVKGRQRQHGSLVQIGAV